MQPFPSASIIGATRSRDGAVLVTVDCPLCELSHLHGLGFDDSRARDLLGPREAHCLDGLSGVYAVTDDGAVLEAFLAGEAELAPA